MFTTILGLLLLQLLVIGVISLVRSLAANVGDKRAKQLAESAESLQHSPAEGKSRRLERVALREAYLDQLHLSWFQLVIVFVTCSVGGLFLEEAWMYFTAHLTQSRVGLVWGPFSPIYGVGAVVLTMIMFQLRKKHAKYVVVFFVAVLVGGIIEQGAGMLMELVFGVESWTYEYLPDKITKYIAWRFLFFWGMLGLVWYRFVMPNMLYLIGEPTNRRITILVALLAVYLSADIFMTLAVFGRMVRRSDGMQPSNALEEYIDDNYDDEWITARFQNLVVETSPREVKNADKTV